MTTESKVDPVVVAVLDVRFGAICEEIGRTLVRTSRSPTFAEAHDFATSVFDKDLRLVAQKDYIPALAMALPSAVKSIASAYEGDIHEGDIFVHNDCYAGNNHIPDINVAKPVFYKGELMFWSAVKGHHVDVGGKGISGYNPSARTIWDEGLTITTCKLYDKGKRNRAVWDLILANVKVPLFVEGDLMCETGGVIVGERGLLNLLDKYGPELIYRAIDEMIAATETETRDKIRQIPDGVYYAEKSTDFDGIVKDKHVTVRVKVIKEGDELTVDLSGSDPQTIGYMNSTYANTISACHLAMHAILGVDGEIKRNEGSQRPIKVVAPEGLVVNPKFPAPVTMCTMVMTETIVEPIWIALSQAIPQWVQASHGKGCRPGVIGFNPRTKKPFINQDFLAGGGVPSGGTEGYDGWDEGGPVYTMGQMRMPDIEIMELACPIHILQYEQEADRAGVGKWRGGNGVHYRVQYLTDCQAVQVGQGLRDFSCPQGLLGGKNPPHARVYLHSKDGQKKDIDTHMYYDIKEGDIYEQHVMGGAGFDDPLEREFKKVQQDVRDGYISLDAARKEYGVVINPTTLQVDAKATEKLRSELRKRR